ncbi:ORF1 [Tacheng Tick Virus 7]|uniref:Nucleoprotein n=1 Tax=Tacheng Tick Virus 7 TaxID=1608089 RepID=A0A0B5KXG4_9RHAB|nr:ORF1 [Tacheng Tick Virus 7]AJG39143.1 ORF1 [Tacheng Tick Virus 7]
MDPSQKATQILGAFRAGQADTTVTATGESKQWEDKELDAIPVTPLIALNEAQLSQLFDYAVGELISPVPVNLPEAVLLLASHVTNPTSRVDDNLLFILKKHLLSKELAPELNAIAEKLISTFKAKTGDRTTAAPPDEEAVKRQEQMLAAYYISKSTAVTKDSLGPYMKWYSDASVADRVEFGCFMSFCLMRSVASQEVTIIRNMGQEIQPTGGSGGTTKGGFYGRYRDLYRGRTFPSCGIQFVTQAAIAQIKAAFSTGSQMLCSILVPVLRVHIQTDPTPSVDVQAVLRYGILMSLEYTGIYLADSYLRALVRTGETGSSLIPKLYWNVHHPEYERLLDMVQKYMRDNKNARAWRWAKCLHSDYLSIYSGVNNPWLCSLFTALFIDKEPQPEGTDVWEKFCLRKSPEHKEWAQKLAAAYWAEKYKNSAITEDSDLVKRIVGVAKPVHDPYDVALRMGSAE